MFGFTRRKVTEHTVASIRPLIGIFQHFNGLPQGFWQNEFVIGFVGFMINFHADVTSGKKLSHEDKGQLLCDVFTALSNINGHEIARQFIRLTVLDPKSPEFEEGADKAAIYAFAMIGKVSEEGRPFFEAARQMAKVQGNEDNHAAVMGYLGMILFYKPAQERFNLTP